jgi:predicted RNA-binding Zn-ribbon protein involved in translation (DUF1610 family)
MEQRLTCANHSDEEIVLNQIGWNNFNCPKCGNDYSLGRKVNSTGSKTYSTNLSSLNDLFCKILQAFDSTCWHLDLLGQLI